MVGPAHYLRVQSREDSSTPAMNGTTASDEASQLESSTHCRDCQMRGDAQAAQRAWATRMPAGG